MAPVRVADARTLRFHRDPLISPQSEMGFVSGVSLATLRTDGGGEWQRLFAPAAQSDVAMGLAISSPMLALAEGRRRIEVTLGFGRRQEDEHAAAPPPGDPPVAAAEEAGGDALAEAVAAVVLSDPAMIEPFGLGPPEAALPVIAGWVERLVAETGMAPAPRLVQHACLRAATTPEQVQTIYGRIVAATLIEGRPWPDGAFRATLLDRVAAQIGGEAAAAVAAGLMARPREEVFQTLLQDAFALSLSSEAGPFAIDVVRVASCARRSRAGHRLRPQPRRGGAGDRRPARGGVAGARDPHGEPRAVLPAVAVRALRARDDRHRGQGRGADPARRLLRRRAARHRAAVHAVRGAAEGRRDLPRRGAGAGGEAGDPGRRDAAPGPTCRAAPPASRSTTAPTARASAPPSPGSRRPT